MIVVPRRSQRVRARHSSPEQCLDQRIGAPRRITAWTGAVDHSLYRQRPECQLGALAEGDFGQAVRNGKRDDPTRVYPQSVSCLFDLDAVGSLRRHTVSMHVPPRTQVAQEAAPLDIGQMLPKALGGGS